MRESHEFEAEFEALGEAEVSLRLDHKEFQDAQRAYALRWLNEKAMARNTATMTRADVLYESQIELTRRAQRFAQVAAACAILALGVAAFSSVIAYKALTDTHVLRAQAAAPVFAPAVAAEAPGKSAAR